MGEFVDLGEHDCSATCDSCLTTASIKIACVIS